MKAHERNVRKFINRSVHFSSVAQSCPTLCDPMNRSTPGPPCITNSRSSLKLMCIKSVMPSSHLILCRPLLLLPPIARSIRVFSNESTLRMRLPKYWSFSFSIIQQVSGSHMLIHLRITIGFCCNYGCLQNILDHLN